MAGGEQSEQLVADLGASHCRAVVVGAAQEQREDVGALFQVGIPAGAGDQGVDDRLVSAAVGVQPRPWIPAAIGSGYRQQCQPRRQRHPLGNHVAQPLKLRTVGPEHAPQNHVERDAHHRFESGELRSFGPGRHLAESFLLGDALVGGDALAVEGRGEQLASAPVFGTVEGEYRAMTEHPRQIGLHIVQHVWPGGEDLLSQRGVGDHDGLAEHRDPGGETTTVLLNLPVDGPTTIGDESDRSEATVRRRR